MADPRSDLDALRVALDDGPHDCICRHEGCAICQAADAAVARLASLVAQQGDAEPDAERVVVALAREQLAAKAHGIESGQYLCACAATEAAVRALDAPAATPAAPLPLLSEWRIVGVGKHQSAFRDNTRDPADGWGGAEAHANGQWYVRAPGRPSPAASGRERDLAAAQAVADAVAALCWTLAPAAPRDGAPTKGP